MMNKPLSDRSPAALTTARNFRQELGYRTGPVDLFEARTAVDELIGVMESDIRSHTHTAIASDFEGLTVTAGVAPDTLDVRIVLEYGGRLELLGVTRRDARRLLDGLEAGLRARS